RGRGPAATPTARIEPAGDRGPHRWPESTHQHEEPMIDHPLCAQLATIGRAIGKYARHVSDAVETAEENPAPPSAQVLEAVSKTVEHFARDVAGLRGIA